VCVQNCANKAVHTIAFQLCGDVLVHAVVNRVDSWCWCVLTLCIDQFSSTQQHRRQVYSFRPHCKRCLLVWLL